MKPRIRSVAGGLALASVALAVPSAVSAQASDAPVVALRKDCDALTDAFESAHCFSTMADLVGWIQNVRKPNEASPLTVLVGPGEFGLFRCSAGGGVEGFVTLRGAGREATRIVDGFVAMEVTGCRKMGFQDLTVAGGWAGVFWTGGGSSSWTNVEVIGGDARANGGPAGPYVFGWYDFDPVCAAGRALHYFFSSKVSALGGFVQNLGFVAECAEHWFYGGEIQALSGDPVGTQKAVELRPRGELRSFGTAIRSGVKPGATGSGPVVGVDVLRDGTFHAHGSIVNTSAGGAQGDLEAVGLRVAPDAQIAHTPGTAFVVRAAGQGTATRLAGPSAKVQSPFLWQASDAPPAVRSLSGADLWVETDCSADGACDGGLQPHLMISSDRCPDGWFDAVTGRCRNEPAPAP